MRQELFKPAFLADTKVLTFNREKDYGGDDIMQHHILRAALCNNDGIIEINKLLDDGWLVKEWHVTSNDESSYAVVLLEKASIE
ncbi:MAG: hypothetical protein FWE98_08990 [Oscillospiraceae bacterium]|nr:hypothetical protein [Oscillospiraceae bacterium]